MSALGDAVAAAALAAVLEPLARELAEYISGGRDDLPDFVHTLPVPLRSRVSIEAAKARAEFSQGAAT